MCPLPSPMGNSPGARFQGLSSESLTLSRNQDPHRNASRSRKRLEQRISGNYPPPRFIGVDGEGVTSDDTVQRYVLLGVGANQIESSRGLSFEQCMAFLYHCFRENSDAVYVGFYLGYDYSHWLRGIPEGRARSLLTPEGIALRKRVRSGGNTVPFPVYYGDWEFDLLGMKRFKLRPTCCSQPHKCRHKKATWMYICDTGPFWQTSLLKAIDPKNWGGEPIVTDTEYRELVQGKESRGAAALDDDMRRYNALENDVLSRLMERQARGLSQMGIRLSKDQWYGPGQASAEWMKQQGIPRRKILQTAKGRSRVYQEIARRAYFGGWFEIFMHGKVAGSSYGYDINSAYPYVMSSLPCLLHGTYTHGKGESYPSQGVYTLLSATVRGSDEFIGAALHRTPTARICRPQRTRGIYWLTELEAGKRAGVIDTWETREWWSYEPCACRCPMSNLAQLYEYRQRVGKDTAVGKAAKLIYNSAYGKFAQSIGNAPFGNWVYASLTTSGCRSIILDAIATHPVGTSSVEMVATDGIFFTSPHPHLSLSENLGDWQESIKEDLFLFKPGFYWDGESKGKATYRSRGIRATDFSKQIPGIESQFDRMLVLARKTFPQPLEPCWPIATMDVSFSITSPLQALRQNDWSRAARVTTDKQIVQSSDPIDKRHNLPFYSEIDSMPILRTLPYLQATKGGLSSRPYDKTYADAQLITDEELGITPDGDPAMEWNIAMKEMRAE